MRPELGFVSYCSPAGQERLSNTLHGNYDPTFAEAFVCSRDPALQRATGLGASLSGPSRHLDFVWKRTEIGYLKKHT